MLYFANQRMFQTADRGEHWQPISPDLTRVDPPVPKTLDAATAADNPGQGVRRGVIYAIAPSALADGLIWAGTDDGLIWRTADGGAHWSDVTPKQLTAWSKVGIIEASPFATASAYAAVDRHRLDDPHPYIYRTRDAGKTWHLAVTGIPDNESVNVVRADPVRTGLLYAGTERSIYLSFDDGDHWQALKKNLPTTSVRDIAVHDADLVIATHGRGIWIMDDVSALRQVNAKVDNAAFWLFAPAPAYRVRMPAFTGTPMPKDEPMAPNPPLGAYIDYTLRSAAKLPIKLDIFDSTGALVRHYSSTDQGKAPDPAKIDVAPPWVVAPSTLSVAAGMHRFVWPIHYAAPAADKPEPYANGVWAPPGNYRVVLTVDGHKLEQPLTVLPDPRITLPASAYAAQFALARKIEQQSVRVQAANQQASELVDALTKAGASTAGTSRGAINALSARVHAMIGMRVTANPYNAWAYPPNTTHKFRFLSAALGNLDDAVDGADAVPSVDAQRGFQALMPIIDATLKSWDQLNASGLAAVNAQLHKAGHDPIRIAPTDTSGGK